MLSSPKDGQVAYLCSGSPPFTVREVDHGSLEVIVVAWVDNKLFKERFPFACLQENDPSHSIKYNSDQESLKYVKEALPTTPTTPTI